MELILRIILNTKVIFHGEENLKKVENYLGLCSVKNCCTVVLNLGFDFSHPRF